MFVTCAADAVFGHARYLLPQRLLILGVFAQFVERGNNKLSVSRVSDACSDTNGVSTYGCDLMIASERETQGSVHSPNNVHFVRATKCVDSPLNAVQLCSISEKSLQFSSVKRCDKLVLYLHLLRSSEDSIALLSRRVFVCEKLHRRRSNAWTRKKLV